MTAGKHRLREQAVAAVLTGRRGHRPATVGLGEQTLALVGRQQTCVPSGS